MSCNENHNFVIFRIPYFCKRVCDSNFARQELVKGVRELYNSTIDDPNAFIDAMADALYDQYEYQRLVKKVSSGIFVRWQDNIESNILSKLNGIFREHHIFDTIDQIGA